MVDLGQALTRAIGKAALAKHLESCATCAEDHECAVGAAHRRMLTRTLPPASTDPSPAADGLPGREVGP